MTSILRTTVRQYRESPLAQNTGWMLFGQSLCLFIQAAYFVIIARSLGPKEYGAFIAVAAATQLLCPFVGLGAGSVLIKHVARDRKAFPQYWCNLISMTAVSGVVASAVLITLIRLFLPQSIPLLVIVLISLADLLFSKFTEGATQAFQAIERLDVVAQLKIISALVRLVGIATLSVLVHRCLAVHWSAVYLLTTIIGATIGTVWVRLSIGKGSSRVDRSKLELRQGLYFATGLASYNINNDIDKVMLARLTTLGAVAIYAAAYRFVAISFTPVSSLLAATYPGFFRNGALGVAGSYKYAKRYLPATVLCGGVATAALFVGAPYVPYFLGPDFQDTCTALRWLALLPLFKSIQVLFADALTGAGYQGIRTGLQFGIAIFNVLVNLWAIPRYSWRGAAWSSLLCDGTLMAGMWILCRAIQERDGRLARNQVASGDLLSRSLSAKSMINL